MSKLPPVHCTVVAPLALAATFDLFFGRMTEWWPLATRSVTLTAAVSCHFEPRIGGRVYERARDGREAPWGTVLVWEPPSCVVFTWHPGLPESAATEVEVRLTAAGTNTRVDLEHRNWERLGENAARIRSLYEGGWVGVLGRFIERSSGAQELTSVTGPGCLDELKAKP